MANQEKRQRLYDIKEYKEKIVAALENLKQTQQPGEVSGKATKTEVLKSVTSEIEVLIKDGYTLKQIANAINQKDIFAIMPKTLTQLFPEKNIRVPTKKRKANKSSPSLENTSTAETPVAAPKVIGHRQKIFEIDEVK